MAVKKKLNRTLKPKSPLSSVQTIQLDWPAFTDQLLPKSSLSPETLLPSQIIVIRKFWTENLCKNYVNFLRTLPLVTTGGKLKKGDAIRFNDRFQINDANFAHRLWTETRLKELICDIGTDETMTAHDRNKLWGGEVIGLNPSIRIYRYGKGQFFDKHYDESNMVSLKTDTAITTSANTTWTFLLYLTSASTGCKGGETVFYPNVDLKKGIRDLALEKLVVKLETGMLLLHKHGKDCILHEGKEVLGGEKWVIRTDLCVKR
ncbi:putative oxoglutarate iron-dependent oxygenase [Erysiphe necator]|uniref:Putative oxoglutarate iron-dependent oxygenase n=1 Tax=Uncinula necator TaxID=52586 RepID=A0A0B1P8A9_UNCNE|nr:putative oxoglutarate iron-dependent oxygenase [Erysiphe necator]